jgi:hypothetical protein
MCFVTGKHLLSGQIKSCGCFSKRLFGNTVEQRRIRHLAAVSWKALIKSAEAGYAEVHPSWSDFEAFFADLGPRPLGTVLSRRDFAKAYSSENCFWEARGAQIRRIWKWEAIQEEALKVQDGSTKRCPKCKLEQPITEFRQSTRTGLPVRQSHCKRCLNESARLNGRKNPVKLLLSRARQRAHKHGLDFNLELSDVLPLPVYCPVFGIRLSYNVAGSGPQPASYTLDRVNNDKGYVRGNVAVISHFANRLKSNGTAAQHERIAEWMCAMDTPRSLPASAGMSAGLL